MREMSELGHLSVCVFLYNFSSFMVAPSITDVTMEALCPGTDHCNLAIYLSGFQQAVTGIGAFILTPIVGNLSDEFGRKTLLTLPMTLAVLPSAILAYGRTKILFYAYYVVGMFSGMLSHECMLCLTTSYVADKVVARRRAAAFGVISGASFAGFVIATLVARFLPTSVTFQVAAATAAFAVVYMRVFLLESVERREEGDGVGKSPAAAGRMIPLISDIVLLVRSSLIFLQVLIIAFLDTFDVTGLKDCLLYYLKAKFHFKKDQFADLFLIGGISGAFSQLFLMPLIVPIVGEERLLSIGLLATCIQMFLNSVAWAPWVPFVSPTFLLASGFTQPCLRSIISKKVGPHEQGMAQGSISGVSSIANVVAPLVVTPLTALFLSKSAPFYFPGFGLMCIGFVSMAAFLQSLFVTRANSTAVIN